MKREIMLRVHLFYKVEKNLFYLYKWIVEDKGSHQNWSVNLVFFGISMIARYTSAILYIAR